MGMVPLEDRHSGIRYFSVGRRDIMLTVRTDTGQWRLYTARRGENDERYAAITYGIEQEILWSDGGSIWPSINTPYGVFRTCESVVQPCQTRMEWELFRHKRKPSEALASNAHKIYIWETVMARKAIKSGVPAFVVQQLVGNDAYTVASILLGETHKAKEGGDELVPAE